MYEDYTPTFSDKDYQLVSKTFRRVSELFYQHPNSQDAINTILSLIKLIPQIVPSKASTNGLTIMSQMEILKAKSRNNPQIVARLNEAIQHVRYPKYIAVNGGLLVEVLRQPELFTVGCTVILRYFSTLKQEHNIDWKAVIEIISQKIYQSPHLSIEVLNCLCSNNEQHVRLAAKTGIYKYISTVYLAENIKDKLHLFRSLKLMRAGAAVDTTVIKDRQNVLATIILAYQEYVPIVSDIVQKCYESSYCSEIVNKDIYSDYLSYPFLWSHIEPFCIQHLNQAIITRYLQEISKKTNLSGTAQTQIFTILSNYAKYSKVFSKQFLRRAPRFEDSLLSYLKLCLNLSQIDQSAAYFINWNEIDNLLQASANPKVSEIAKYLRDSMGKEGKVGTLNANLRKIFSSEKNADLMMERAVKRPKNNEELEIIKQILSLKQKNNEFDADTLQMAKYKACQSLRDAIAQQTLLDINAVLRIMQLNDVHLVAKMLQAVELHLMRFQQAIDQIDLKRILEMITWIQDNYRGQIIDWGSISQLLLTLVEEEEWKRHLKSLPKKCFWILSINDLSEQDDRLLWDAIKRIDPEQLNRKMPFILGFLGKVLSNSQKVEYLRKHRSQLDNLTKKLAKNENYELTAMMLSYFLRGWAKQQEDYEPQRHKKAFEQFIGPIDKILSSHLRLIPQDYYLLESCLPYKIHLTNNISSQLQSLVRSNGKLASYIYEQEIVQKKKGYQGKLLNLKSQPVESIHQSMIFAQKCPNVIKANQLKSLINHIAQQPKSYWEMYPRYVDILANVINVVGNSQSQSIQTSLTELSQKLINEIISNPSISDDQRQELLEQLRDSFENMKQKGVYIQVERVKKIVTKIVDKEIREQIIILLNNYKIKEERKLQMKVIREEEQRQKEREDKKQLLFPLTIKQQSKSQKLASKDEKMRSQREYQLESQFDNSRARQSTVILIGQPQDREEAYSSVSSLENQFESIKSSRLTSLLQAFEILKRIVNKELPFSRFKQLYELFSQHELNDPQKQLLGSLLASLYRQQQCPDILNLLLNKDKTMLSKQTVFELISTFIPAFSLCKRWKLVSREYLDIAMKRVKQGFLADGCHVATFNLVKTNDLEQFYSKNYHQIILELADSANLEEELIYLLSLIGMAARFPQIRAQWIKHHLHLKVLKFVKAVPKSVKVIGNLAFALSSLTFEENTACVDVVKQTELIHLTIQSLLTDPRNLSIAQYGSLFLGNLSFSKCFEAVPDFPLAKVLNVLSVIFEANLDTQNMTPYKHLLKALGNMSIIPGCSSMMLTQQFCRSLVKFAEKIDILTVYDQKKQKYMKLLLDLVTSLATNKDLDKLIVLHNSKLTLLTITLLQTIETSHADLIASCIDAIDALCQQPNLELWYVGQKKLPYILLDILKLQSEDKLVIKAIRLITNLTLHQSCIPFILKSNLLGVIANIVVPQLGIRTIAQQNNQTSKKIQLYILKIITRIYQTKPNLPVDQILKSGFLDCVVRIIEMTDVEEKFLDILFHYSPHIPNFLNKRAFSTVIKILTLKVNNKNILVKCLQSLKNILSFTYDVEQEGTLIKGLSQMYLKFISTEFRSDALFLLSYHLLRSHQFRQLLRKPDNKLLMHVKMLSKEEQDLAEICKSIIFLIYNQPCALFLDDYNQKKEVQYYQYMKKGFKCKLYRADGSFKDAIIDIDGDYNFRAYKYPDGQIKSKYVVNVRHIRDFQVEYEKHDELWRQSVFSAQKGLFNSHVPVSKNCCTIAGNSRWGEIHLINVEFNNWEEKILFFKILSYLIAIFRL